MNKSALNLTEQYIRYISFKYYCDDYFINKSQQAQELAEGARGELVVIEYPLERLKDSIGRFIVPSAALLDIQALRAQIELRRLALMDIEVISSRLRLWDGRTAMRLHQRCRGGPARQPSLSRLRRGRLFMGPA